MCKKLQATLTEQTESFFMFRVMTKQETIKWVLGSVALIQMNENMPSWAILPI